MDEIYEKVRNLMELYTLTEKMSDSKIKVYTFGGENSYLFFDDSGKRVLNIYVGNDGSIYVSTTHKKGEPIINAFAEWQRQPKIAWNSEIHVISVFDQVNFLRFKEFEEFFHEIIIGKIAVM